MKKNELLRMYKASAETRGSVLEKVTELESIIDFYIASHFIDINGNKNKFEEFMSLIIVPNVIFNKKIEIFKSLIKKYHPEFKKVFKNYPADFERIGKERNMFAHLPLNISEEAVDMFVKHQTIQYLRFGTFKDKSEIKLVQFEPFSDKYVNSFLDMVHNYSAYIKSLVT